MKIDPDLLYHLIVTFVNEFKLCSRHYGCRSSRISSITVANHKIYVTNSGDNTVSVINTTTDKKEPHDIGVGSYPRHVAFDTDTGMIYVLNSNTVSVIDSSSDKVQAGVIFRINPPNSGKILCKDKQYPTNIYLYVDAGTYCRVQSDNGFLFNSLVESLPTSRFSLLVQKFLKLHGVNITHVDIYKWIKKYVVLMKSCLEKITPNVAVAWRADELYVSYPFVLMDD